jgi:hypothetical protein
MKHYVYLIDGVAQPQRIWQRRQVWGEHPQAQFTVVEVKRATM